MLRLYSLIATLLLLTVFSVKAQRKEPCSTMEMDSLLRLKYPGLGKLDEFERVLQRKIVEIKARQAASREVTEVITIPVIVHVIHNGEAVGAGRNLSEAQVKAQIETINEDFRRKPGTRGFNTDARGADVEIEFCMAQLDPQGRRMTEPGIDRVNGAKASWSRTDIENDLKPRTSWDPNKYCNIWVLDFAAQDNQLLGYAQFPSQSNLSGIPENGGPANTDGVVIVYTSFGNAEKGSFPIMRAPYNLGRTLSHELGHWLGLRHIWGDANCGNDFVEDTPAAASESRGCQSGRMSCGTVNMVENYMDYSDDACFNIFTKGQKTRIRAVMELSPRRGSLLTSNVCGTTTSARPVANFQAENTKVLLGGQVRFTDLSSNFPTRWQWEFEGGDPSTSTDQSPIVTYRVAGKYKVSLTVSNAAGSSATAIKIQYIEVLNVGLCAEITNFKGTATVIRQTPGTGYVSGQNSRRTRAISEYFDNVLGYTNLRGATLRFGVAKSSKGRETEAVVKVTAWNARGFQNGPGAVLETKEIPLRKLIDDVANNRATVVTFDRNLPLFSLPYHIGIELDYVAGDTIALATTRDGEVTTGTAWELSDRGEWDRYIVRNGLNVAHAIAVSTGMKPSVQVAASAQFVDPNQSVTLDARGASIFNWKPNAGLNAVLGPQVIARPTQTTTYTVKGTNSDVCVDSAQVTIYVRNVQILGNPTTLEDKILTVSPNPTDGTVQVAITNNLRGKMRLKVYNLLGAEVLTQQTDKTEDTYNQSINLRSLPAGSYILELQTGEVKARKRIVKY
jgi:PKD repeat protein